MRSGMSIWFCLAISLVSGTGCALLKQKVNIPNVELYKPIPFLDGEEAASVETISHKEKLYTAAQWSEIRPFVVCMDPKGWQATREEWYNVCRYAGEECNVIVNTLDTYFKKLDALAKQIIEANKGK